MFIERPAKPAQTNLYSQSWPLSTANEQPRLGLAQNNGLLMNEPFYSKYGLESLELNWMEKPLFSKCYNTQTILINCLLKINKKVWNGRLKDIYHTNNSHIKF